MEQDFDQAYIEKHKAQAMVESATDRHLAATTRLGRWLAQRNLNRATVRRDTAVEQSHRLSVSGQATPVLADTIQTLDVSQPPSIIDEKKLD